MPEWYYAEAGERVGPVAWTDLKTRADGGALDPRMDLVWKAGMAEWIPAGQVEGLFARNAPVPVHEAPANPYVPPMRVREDDARLHYAVEWPGLRRRAYLAGTILFPFILSFASGFMRARGLNAPWVQWGSTGLLWIVSLYVTLQRFANLGMSRWWVFANLVPFLNLWTGYRLFACPAGYAQTRKLDGIGTFLAIFYWLMLVLGIVIVAFAIYYLLHAGGNPEIRRIIGEAMAKARASRR